MATERKQEASTVKDKQVKLRVANMLGSLKTREFENAVFVKSKSFLGWSNVEFVRLETGFVCKLEECDGVDRTNEVAIPSLLRSKGIYYDDPRDSLAVGLETVLTAVDPESVHDASLLRVTVSNPMCLPYTEHVAVNREEVIEAIHRRCRGHILTEDAVLGIVVDKKELRVHVTGMESLSFTKLKMAKIGAFTTVRVIPTLGLYGVTLLTEINADAKPQAKAGEAKPQADDNDVAEASLLRITVSNPKAVATGHLAVNRDEVVDEIHRRFKDKVLTNGTVFQLVVDGKELSAQITLIDSLSHGRCYTAKVSVFTSMCVDSAQGLYGVTLLSEIKADAKPNPDDHDVAKSSEALTSEAMRVFSALLSIIQYDAECSTPEHINAMEDASKILECRLKQLAKEMERRSA